MAQVKLGRRFLLGTAGVGVLAAPAILSGRAHAQTATQAGAQTGAQTGGQTTGGQTATMDKAMTTQMPPPVDGFKLGDFEVLVVRDGARPSGKPNETFGTNQSAEAVGELLEENFLPADNFVNSFSPTLVKAGNELVLFDTGFGAAGRANGMGRLQDGMKLAGYAPEDVTIVVLTHLHGDHIGGLMENGKAAFPNARYVTGQREYDFWTSAERAGTPAEGGQKAVMANVKPLAEKMTFIDEGGSIISGITGMNAFGHTPGHMIYTLESAGRQLVLTADTANHYVLSLQRPEWEVRFDMDKAAAAATRKRVFDMLATDKVAFLGYHMPFPSVGFVEKQDSGYRFVPKSYQFDI
ncbi:MBL fold metallo-hydrolase [Rhizobium sp. SSA_523]|uniref:MBL fold metallo-hydrolase n=1 Tax=Rhizobium sp. SSA_523 TaxID=2952477 RepID=UPI0020915257|nr:MBL fold metallo-hydrolase [Rhizobium sp. SSA_523]MCO5733145.1 MBL fold metallo-hydrolase [Rhizobium sp. SSA_523]WKC24018.1 MBL fold metallo-hydrolase [Rhizobium sp. SSA_523]